MTMDVSLKTCSDAVLGAKLKTHPLCGQIPEAFSFEPAVAKMWPTDLFINQVLLGRIHARSPLHCLWLLACDSGRAEQIEQRL